MRLAPLYVVLAWMVALIPPRPRAMSYVTIAQATVDACDTVECMAELVAIARYESTFTVNARGPAGECGPWQIKPVHLRLGCKAPIAEQAAKAVELLARSRAACAENEPLEQAAGYTSGRCDWGKRESRERLGLAAALLR